jgi:hypothetical protein
MENIKFIPMSEMAERVLEEMKSDSQKPIMGSIILYHNGGEARNMAFTSMEAMSTIFSRWRKEYLPLIRRGDKIKLVIDYVSSKYDK